jgi:hypothetical protein
MLDNNVTVSDGTSDHIYGLTETGVKRSVRSETAAALAVPANLRIQHEILAAGTINQRQRSLVSFDRVVDDALGNYGTIRCNFTLDIPEKIATSAEVVLTAKEMILFLNGTSYANLTKIINGEI